MADLFLTVSPNPKISDSTRQRQGTIAGRLESDTLWKKWVVDYVWADIVQEVVNAKRLTLLKNYSIPLQIHWVHDTLVVQPKELYKENQSYTTN